MKKETIKTTKIEIANHWRQRLESQALFPFNEATQRCWRCGKKTKRTQLSHIIPESIGGTSQPSNLVLLCATCHKECPDVRDSNLIWKWIEVAKKEMVAGVPETYWGMRATHIYDQLYDIPFVNVVENIAKKVPIVMHEEFCKKLNNYLRTDFRFKNIGNDISVHWGEGYSLATTAYSLHRVLELLDNHVVTDIIFDIIKDDIILNEEE